MKLIISRLILLLLAFFLITDVHCQYRPVQHRMPSAGEIAVTAPGCFVKPGRYILVNDISSPRSAIFLGKDIILDLNGYSVSFADGAYNHLENYGFEEGLKGWDLSNAPGAAIESTEATHAFIGDKLLRLKAGDEIVSGYVSLPEANRSYYAMCGVTANYYYETKGDPGKEMRVSIYVDDEQGREISCMTSYGDSMMLSCPVINRSPRLGGGFVFAHLNNLPAGKYRIRVKAETDCLLDEIDIRPAMDAGIGIVGKTDPFGHNDHLSNNMHVAFFDYTQDVSSGKPARDIPVSEGSGTVTIRNGTIRNATEGVLSWGIQSTAPGVRVILDNVMIISSGINTTAVDVEQASITKCTFDVRNPFIINRHGSEFYAVDLRGAQSSEVSYSEFRGGQGCLCIKGRQSVVHHNFFANRQTVTNHYSIMAMGDGLRIFENRFEPESGSGIEIYKNKYIEIYDNEFVIKAAPPSCEYNDHLSTNAIRIADYGAKPGSPAGCYGNRIFNNRFFITGKYYAGHPDFIPMASAFFYSASGGENEISGNEIFINQENPGTKAEAYAFYIGNSDGGLFRENRIVTNVTPVWVACGYGGAKNTVLDKNSIEKAENAPDFVPVRLGSDYLAEGTIFRSNTFPGDSFGINATAGLHTYMVCWSLTLNLYDNQRNLQGEKEVVITDRSGKEVLRELCDPEGQLTAVLPEYTIEKGKKTLSSPYTIRVGKTKKVAELHENSHVTMILQ